MAIAPERQASLDDLRTENLRLLAAIKQLQMEQEAARERTTELAKANAILQAEVVERKRAEQVSRGQTEAMIQALKVLAAEPN